MKRSKTLVLLAVACMLTGLIAVVSCETTSVLPTESGPELRDRPFNIDGIRVNGTETCGKCGIEHRLWAVGYGDAELHFCTEADAQAHVDHLENGDRSAGQPTVLDWPRLED